MAVITAGYEYATNTAYQDIVYAPLSGKWYLGHWACPGMNTWDEEHVEISEEKALEEIKKLTGYQRGPKKWLRQAKKGYDVKLNTYDDWSHEEIHPIAVEVEKNIETLTPEDLKTLATTKVETKDDCIELIIDTSNGWTRESTTYCYNKKQGTWHFAYWHRNNTYDPYTQEVSREKILKELIGLGIKKKYALQIVQAVENGHAISVKEGQDF